MAYFAICRNLPVDAEYTAYFLNFITADTRLPSGVLLLLSKNKEYFPRFNSVDSYFGPSGILSVDRGVKLVCYWFPCVISMYGGKNH